MRATRRVLSFVLIIVIALSLIPVLKIQAFASCEDEVKLKLDAIIQGPYGDGKRFPDGIVSEELAGSPDGEQCFGFSRFVFFAIFNVPAPVLIERNSDEYALESQYIDNVKEIASCKYSVNPNGNTEKISREAFGLAKAGDLVQCRRRSGSAHSMIVYSVEETGVWILDCNVMLGEPNVVHFRFETFQDFAYYNRNFTIYRAKAYEPISDPVQKYSKSSRVYFVGDEIYVSWTASPVDSALDHYWLSVRDENNGEIVFEKSTQTVPHCSFTLSRIGTYSVTIWSDDLSDSPQKNTENVVILPASFKDFSIFRTFFK